MFVVIKTELVLWLCVGLGTNEKSVISVLGQRNASQRKKIRETYQQLYNKSLIDDINSELSGDFRVQSIFLLFLDLIILFSSVIDSQFDSISSLEVIPYRSFLIFNFAFLWILVSRSIILRLNQEVCEYLNFDVCFRYS